MLNAKNGEIYRVFKGTNAERGLLKILKTALHLFSHLVVIRTERPYK